MPTDATHEQAAALPVAALTALQCLRDRGDVQPGQRVLVNGAAGGVGTFAAQIAQSFGAEVTGVCSTRNLQLVQSIGADRVVDYTREDFSRNGQRYDLIVDAVGNRSLSDYRRALGPNGTYVAAAGPLLRSLWISVTPGKRTVAMTAKPNQADLEFLAELLEAGDVTSVIRSVVSASSGAGSDSLHRGGSRARKGCDHGLRRASDADGRARLLAARSR